jgi:hypothetical protein
LVDAWSQTTHWPGLGVGVGFGGLGVGLGFGGFGVGVGFAGLGVGLGLVSAQVTEAEPRVRPIPTRTVTQIFVIGFKTANRFFINQL